MSLSLRESQAIAELATLLSGFLPGKPHPYANQSISFQGISSDLRLDRFWPGGSKVPSITQLLSLTLEQRRGDFCNVIIEVVRRGITYRQNKGPLVREEIEALNGLLEEIGFKIPDLHDRRFLNGLPRAGQPGNRKAAELSPKVLEELSEKLITITNLPPTKRGYEFEWFLSEMFKVHDLAPRGSFRLIGEQIDGSFKLEGETYLVEAKWQSESIGIAELLTFSGKVGRKAKWSRGIFISISRFADDGLEAFSRGQGTDIICMDGLDLMHVLQGKLDLRTVIERKVRRAAETNRAFVPVRELFAGVN